MSNPNPNQRARVSQERNFAHLAAPTERTLTDLSLAQRLDPGSLVLLNRLSSGALSSQALLQAEDGAILTGKLIAGDYLVGTSATFASLAPLLARTDYSEADLLYLLAAYAAKNGSLDDASIAESLLAARSPFRRLTLWLKAHSSIWPD